MSHLFEETTTPHSVEPNPDVSDGGLIIKGFDNEEDIFGNNEVIFEHEKFTLQGSDIIHTFGRDDSVNGGAGDDEINLGDGRDVGFGGEGNDTLRGEDGRDLLKGKAGDDLIEGGDDRDTLEGGSGNDTISGGDDRDLIDGGSGNDLLFGGDKRDTLEGGAGNDTLIGGEDRDSLIGGDGNDLLVGGDNRDTLEGGDGHDTLNGGDEDDVLSGGHGADVFEYTAEEGVDVRDIEGAFGEDTITDFDATEDTIALDSHVFTNLDGNNGELASNEFKRIDDFNPRKPEREGVGHANLIYDGDSGLVYYRDEHGEITPFVNVGEDLDDLGSEDFKLL